MKTRYPMKFLFVLLAILIMAVMLFAKSPQKEYYVYQYVLESAEGDFETNSSALENAARNAGWQVLAKMDAGVPPKCPYRSRVFILFDSTYAGQIMKANSQTGPFAVVDRINLFQDENGTHISIVNPHSINRTILMDDEAYEEMTENHLQSLRQWIISAVKGKVSEKGYGKKRKQGYIGKTMGVMAGGKFQDKIKVIAAIPNSTWKEVATRLFQNMQKPGSKWGMHAIYRVELPKYQIAVLGTSGSQMESKSFSIVKAGSDKTRKKFKCPGIAHAAAYPIELVVRQNGKNVNVEMVDAMFRMKMYFEDAGKWAFMKNMGMPGSIASEIRGQIKMAIGTN